MAVLWILLGVLVVGLAAGVAAAEAGRVEAIRVASGRPRPHSGQNRGAWAPTGNSRSQDGHFIARGG